MFQFSMDGITGYASLEVVEADGLNPSTVLDRTQSFVVETEWNFRGPNVANMGGDWHLTAYFESLGPQPEVAFALATAIPAGQANYNQAITIPPGTIQADGIYRLVVALTHTDVNGIPSKNAGYQELSELLQFYS
jgi:hypothetical protein